MTDVQGDLFSGPMRPEEDPFVLEILRRFGGAITHIGPAPDGGAITHIGPAPERTESVWIETVRPRARRRVRATEVGGRPEAVQLEETIRLGKYSSYEKARPKGSTRPWQLVWSESREPLGVGLFDSKQHAEDFRRTR